MEQDAFGMDTSLLWLERLYRDNEAEVLDDVPEPLALIPWEGRVIIWNLAERFIKKDFYGIAGQACQLLERYLGACFRRFTGWRDDDPAVQRKRQLLKYDLCCNIIMLAGVCIQLSAKMNSAVEYVGSRELQDFLRQHERYYTMMEINRAEADVFSTIGFRIPLWTNVEKARMLARELGMVSPLMMETVALVMDVAEFCLVVVQKKIYGMNFESPGGDGGPSTSMPSTSMPSTSMPSTSRPSASMPSTSRPSTSRPSTSMPSTSRDTLGISNIRSMHLIAGAIAAAGIIARFSGPDPVARLASLTHCPVSYVISLCNAIVHCMNIIKNIVMKSNIFEQPSTKRKLGDLA